MRLKLVSLGVFGAAVLVTGLYLAFARLPQFYPGLVIVVGCFCCAAFLLANHDAWSVPSR